MTTSLQVKPRVYLTAFASDRWVPALTRLRSDCKASGFVDVFHQYTLDDLRSDPQFWSTHGKFIEENPRGRGYWIWKPHIILHSLSHMADGDILIYADAGCTIHSTGADRFQKYVEILRTSPHGILTFNSEHPIYKWTKADTIKALGAESIADMNCVIATSIILRKCDAVERLIRHWSHLCAHYHLLDDSPSVAPNHPDFIEHKHDQSIFSLLVRQAGCYVTLDNETWTYPNWDPKMPIWASRART